MDSSFTTDVIFSVERDGSGFCLRPVALQRPITKVLPLDNIASSFDFTRVVEIDGQIVGFVAADLQQWNRRLALPHLYVDSGFRRRGLGAALVADVCAFGRRVSADHVWVETSNLNPPAIAAYRRWGFELCGLDTALYGGTPARGEAAIYLAMPLAT